MRISRSPRPAKGRPRPDRRFQLATALVVVVAFFATLGWPRPDVRPEAAHPVAALATTPATGGAAFECDVAYVNDGDTLGCTDGTKVRLHAVAAREADETCAPGHPCPSATGASATALLNRLATGKTLTCEPTGQSYKRVTAICRTADGEEINCAMVRSGTTLIWETFDRRTPICRP
jgi:endonuclease YncB( thermonuclease family)